MKVIFVNRFFYPDLAPTGLLAADVAFDLAARGWEVHAVTSRQCYAGVAKAFPPEQTLHGTFVHRVWTTRFGPGMAGRVLDYATFYLSASWRLFRLLRTGDIVVAKTDPPLISVFALLVARWRGARLVNWLEDVFPEVAQRVGIAFVNGPIGTVAKRLRDASLCGASANVVLGPRMAAEVGRLVPGAKLEVIANWSDAAAIRPIPSQAGALQSGPDMRDTFVVAYSGNFGRAHDYDTIVQAIEILRGDPEICFSFTGGGYYFSRIGRFKSERGLSNVFLRGYVETDRLSENLASSDALLVTLRPELEGLIMPSKLYAAMAAGRPILFVGDPDGEVGSVLREHRCGLCIAPGDGQGLVKSIRYLKSNPQECREMGARARAALEAHYDKQIGLQRWRRLIEKIGGAPAKP